MSTGAAAPPDLNEIRIDRMESEVSSIRGDMTTLTREVSSLKSDVKGLGSILGRIEAGVSRAQEHAEAKENASRPNLIALVSVMITIISILIGGAWMIAGALARSDERDIQRTRELELTTQFRNRELDAIRSEVAKEQDRAFSAARRAPRETP